MDKVILFDFDGVIVDSEKIYYKKWKEASLALGYELSHEELLSLRSCDSSIAKDLFGSIEDYHKVRNIRRSLMEEYLSKQMFELKPNIIEAFEYLKAKGYTIIIASSSTTDMIERHLRYYNLKDYIYEVLSVKSLKRGKPYPDIYLEICKHYNLDPKSVYAVEDSPNGVTSAYSAGVKVLMIPDLTKPDEELSKKIDKVLTTALDIKDII